MAGVRTVVDSKPLYRTKGEVRILEVSADGSKLLMAGGALKVVRNPSPASGVSSYTGVPVDCSVRIWDLRRKKEFRCLTGHDSPVVAAAFLDDGSIVSVDSGCDARGRAIGMMRSWSSDGSEQFTVRDACSSLLAIFPKSNLIVSADKSSSDSNLYGWDLGTGKSRFKLKGNQNGIDAWAPFPDQNLLLTGGRCGAVYLWDVLRRKLVREYQVTDHVDAAAWHPSGMAFATAILPDGASPSKARPEVSVWDVATAKQVAKPSQENCVIHVWDNSSGKEVLCLKGHTQLVNTLAFTPDCKTLFSAGSDKAVRCWKLPQGRKRQTASRR
jgi:WD40 repeat protein